ncbi:hypothetical protein J5N97_021860 [Dioscorea zingiberensis]|uniref:Uncharacterized protein n=1 Tax=Dioscorea zingiberensis TaxID=325984 RepID=A0A9D5C9F5_9LILI|nr:hypothetical protein J5N97_021860 [Dioscorea zingiberensis]
MDRRFLFSSASIIAGVSSILCMLFSKKKSKHSWAQLGLEAVGFMTASMAYDVLLIYGAELFPTNVRNFASSMLGQTLMLGGAMAPVLVVLGRLSPALSFIVFGGFAIFSGILTVWLPDTRNVPLYETLEEQEKEEKLDVKLVRTKVWIRNPGMRVLSLALSRRGWRALAAKKHKKHPSTMEEVYQAEAMEVAEVENEDEEEGGPTETTVDLTVNEIIEQHVGSFGLSQFLQVFLVSLAWMFDAQSTLVTIFIFTDAQPAWKCKVASSSCSSSTLLCGLEPGRSEWIGGHKTSTVAEWNLICSHKFIAFVPSSMFFIGSIFSIKKHKKHPSTMEEVYQAEAMEVAEVENGDEEEGGPTETTVDLTVNEIIEQHVGSFGLSQFLQVFLVSLAWMFDAQSTLVTIFTYAQPAWKCKVAFFHAFLNFIVWP